MLVFFFKEVVGLPLLIFAPYSMGSNEGHCLIQVLDLILFWNRVWNKKLKSVSLLGELDL